MPFSTICITPTNWCLPGKINDVGAYTRTNIPKSYRAGIELDGTLSITRWLKAAANIAMSRNKVMSL